MRALFINPGGIGDQILFLPTGKLLKDKYPPCEIDLICEPRSSCIGQITNLYRKIREFDFKVSSPSIFELRNLIRRRKYRYLISSGLSYKANLVAFLGHADFKIGFYKGVFTNLLLTNPVKINTEQYVSNMFAELLTPVIPEVKDITRSKILIPEIKINPEAIEWAKETLSPRIKERYYAKKIFIHPGVSSLSIKKNIIKTWGPKNWASLIEKLLENTNNTVILLGGKDDFEIISEIHKNLSFFARPKNFFDLSTLDITLDKLGALIGTSDLLVCVDSAPMHIAVALGKKLVAYFGPTDPKKLLPLDLRFTGICNATPEMMLNAINSQLTVSAPS